MAIAAMGLAIHGRRTCIRLSRDLVAARELFELANDPVLVADIVHGKLIEVNGAACDLLGYSRSELLELVLPELHPKELRSKSAQLIADVWESKGLVYQLPMLTKSGEQVETEVSAKVFTFHDKPSMLIFARDISERLKLEGQLAQSRKMASLGQLVAGVAHEINTPIGAIHANAGVSAKALAMLRKALEDRAPQGEKKSAPQGEKKSAPQGEGGLRAIVAGNKKLERAFSILEDNNQSNLIASERIVETVDALRNFARLDESDRKRANLHDGIDSTLKLLRHELRHGVEVVKEYGDIPEIECWPNQLNQVFMNVLVNAVQAMDGNGTITIASRRDGPTEGGQDAGIAISFRDTGKGIAPADIGRIFDPGFTRKGVGVGTGLGLSISYQIMERHEGSIQVESELGKGTTMTLRIPEKAK